MCHELYAGDGKLMGSLCERAGFDLLAETTL